MGFFILVIYAFMKTMITPICSYITNQFHRMLSLAKEKCIVGYQAV